MGRGRFPPSLRRRAGVMLAAWAIALSLLAVSSAVPSGPEASLSADDVTPLVHEPVRFDASASQGHDEGNGRIVAYRFDFGDGEGTDWQPSSSARHTYGSPGIRTASVVVRDGRALEARASLDVDVRSLPPPSGDDPDLAPISASLEPEKPETDDVVVLALTIMNRGAGTATAASIDVTDVRPSGAEIRVGTAGLPHPLGFGETVSVASNAFLAVEAGGHVLRIAIRDVVPVESRVADNALEVSMTVAPKGSEDGRPDGGPGFVIDPLVAGLVVGAVAALIGAVVLLTRPREPWPPYPPPPAPPDERPPPAWPP